MAGVHRLQHVERFGGAHFADDDPVGPHPQGVPYQIALGDLALAFQAGRPGFQTHHMRLLQLQFGRVFDRDDALGRIDHARLIAFSSVVLPDPVPPEMMMFSRARPAISSTRATCAVRSRLRPGGRNRCRRLANLRIEIYGPSSASGGEHDIDAGAVQQARIAPSGCFHRPGGRSTTRCAGRCCRHAPRRGTARPTASTLPAAFDKYPVRPVHHDIGDAVVVEQRLQRPEAQHVVDKIAGELALFAAVKLDAPLGGDIGDQTLDFRAQTVGRQRRDGRGIDAQQTKVTQFGDWLCRVWPGRDRCHRSNDRFRLRSGVVIAQAAKRRHQRIPRRPRSLPKRPAYRRPSSVRATARARSRMAER